MKILVLTNLYPPLYVGGYELHCRTVVEALRQRGHEVAVLSSDHGLEKAPLLPPEPHVYRALKIHGMFGHPFLGILQLQSLEAHNNRLLISMLQDVKPDLVYVWSLTGLSRSLLFTLQRRGIPTVLSICDLWLADSEKSDVWMSWWNRSNPKKAQRLLRAFWTWNGQRGKCQNIAPTNTLRQLTMPRLHFCSQAMRDATAAAGINVQQATVIYCSANMEKFNGPPRRASQPMQRLLFVGRLVPDKGVMTALRAMALVRDKFAGTLSVYGRGETAYEKELFAFAQGEKLPVTFKDLLNPERMPDVYRAHDALLFPSEWMEPFAITPLEAMACGLPVIGTTTGGSAELFRHRENALTYTAGEPEELAQRILELDSDNNLRERIAREGQSEVRARFSEPAIVDQIEMYLHESLRTWKPAPLPDYRTMPLAA